VDYGPNHGLGFRTHTTRRHAYALDILRDLTTHTGDQTTHTYAFRVHSISQNYTVVDSAHSCHKYYMHIAQTKHAHGHPTYTQAPSAHKAHTYSAHTQRTAGCVPHSPSASGSGPLRPQIVPGTKTREGSERAEAPDIASMTSLSSRPWVGGRNGRM
jgi:hypothetical protein